MTTATPKPYRGSEWRKWDLHFHTPSSYDYDDKSVTNKDIIESLKKADISVVAITDHHFIDAQRIKDLKNIAKNDIVIFPGIELCSDARGNEPIHFIGIFPEDCDIEYVWNEINSKADIAKKKQEGKKDNEIYCDLEKTSKLIKDLGGIVSIHAGSKSNSIEKITNSLPVKMAEKEDITKCVDIFELGQEKDQDGYTQKVFSKIGTYPMIICSDNHNARKYQLKLSCWIKADTTFEGLKQIKYEPKERVYIGSENPSAFKHSIINSFSISPKNETFFFKKIGNFYFNDGLNCVIGSRGAGKSALLDAIAFSLGDNDVLNKDRNNYVGFFFQRNETNIISSAVKNSHSGEEKNILPKTRGVGFLFDYYHQKRIGYLADPNNEEILSRFLFEKIFKEGRRLDSLFSELDEGKNHVVSKLAVNREKVVACVNEISKEGEIQDKILEKNSRAEFLSQKDIKNLLEERAKIIKLRERLIRIKTRIEKMDKDPIIADEEVVDTDFFSELQLSPIDPEGTIVPAEWKELEATADRFVKSLDTDKEKVKSRVEELTKKVIDIAPLFNFKTRLTSIWEQIQAESSKKGITITTDDLEKLDLLQKEITVLEEQLETINGKKKEKTTLLDERKKFLEEYKEHLGQVEGALEANFNDLLKNDGAVLKYTIKLEVKINLSLDSYLGVIVKKAKHDPEAESPRFPNKNSLLELFNSLGSEKIIGDLHHNCFDNWIASGFGAGGLEYFQKMQNKAEVAMYLEEILPSLTSRLLWRPDSTREFKSLKKCSIGERGTALLSVILITGREPLIIDQPEDDLDHFYLYKTLTPIIKEVKKRRQLIFATHDANIVVNGDAELLVITKTDDGEFGEVILTSIENLDNREWVMEVLEGGRAAFKKRRDKYGKTAE